MQCGKAQAQEVEGHAAGTRDEPLRTSSWEAKTNPNFQLVNKPPQGSITAVKKIPYPTAICY